MCRSITTLFNFEPPATEVEIREASLQFVRKISGFPRPSRANEAAFGRAVDDVAKAARTLLDSLVTDAEPRTREAEDPTWLRPERPAAAVGGGTSRTETISGALVGTPPAGGLLG